MKKLWIGLAIVAMALIAGCGDQYRTETKIDNSGKITRKLTFYFQVDAKTEAEARAALNLDRFQLPPGGTWEKFTPSPMDMQGNAAPEPDANGKPYRTEQNGTPDGAAEVGGTPAPMAPQQAGWQYVVATTYEPGAPISDFVYKYPGRKDIAAFTVKNEFQVTKTKRADGKTELVFTEKMDDAGLQPAIASVLADVFVQPIVDEVGADAPAGLAADLRAALQPEAIAGMMQSSGPPSGNDLGKALDSMFMATLTKDVGAEKAKAVITRIGQRASRPSYMMLLIGGAMQGFGKLDEMGAMLVTDEITVPGSLKSLEGGDKMGGSKILWTYSQNSMNAGPTTSDAKPKPKALKIVTVVP